MTPRASGQHDPRFSPVVDVFEQHLAARPESGAALAVHLDGRPVVDVWGGVADATTGRAWTRDTTTLAFSCGKSVTAVVLLHLAERGDVDLDATVATYWPEFGAGGKQDVTVRQVLAHRAGVPWVEAPLTLEDVLRGRPLLDALEQQAPLFPPGTGYSYHAITVGAVVGEVVRRATGRTLGTVLQDAVCRPLGLDLWIGVPEQERARVAPVLPADDSAMTPEVRAVVRSQLTEDATRAVTLGGALKMPFTGLSRESSWNDPRIWAIELPAANAIGTARAFARLHAGLVSELDDGDHGRSGRLLRASTLEDATRLQSTGPPALGPAVEPFPAWGTGFMLASELRPMLGATSFGHDGAAGGLCFADEDAGIGFAYLPNQMGDVPDLRANSIVDALRGCLA